MKKLVFVLVLCATPAFAQDPVDEFCTSMGTLAGAVQQGRNIGTDPTPLLNRVKNAELTREIRELIARMIVSIYQSPTNPPEQTNAGIRQACFDYFGNVM